MTGDDEKTTSLVPWPSSAISRTASKSLVQRGMQDWLAADDAEQWFKKGLELEDLGQGEQATSWYRKAADQGNATAQHYLGWAYECGCGVPEDDEQAAFWYRKAANQGDATGQFMLGSMYLEGRGVPRDPEQAVYWYRKCADQGESWAHKTLGEIYEAGEIVPQDYAQAAYWYLKIGVLGPEHFLYRVLRRHDIVYRLGHMYEHGLGVPKDPEQAARWYREAEQGERLAKAAFNSRLPKAGKSDD
jgi:hypothetical protein